MLRLLSRRYSKPSRVLLGGEATKMTAASLAERSSIFDELFDRQERARRAQVGGRIWVTLPDGKKVEGRAFETTPLEVAAEISKILAENSVVARVKYLHQETWKKTVDPEGELEDLEGGLGDSEGGFVDPNNKDLKIGNKRKISTKGKNPKGLLDLDAGLVDLSSPLRGDCYLDFLTLEDSAGQRVLRHSAAHMLGHALEQELGALLCHGPATESGFFYDAYIDQADPASIDLPRLTATAAALTAANVPFLRIEVTRDEALRLFRSNPFKLALIREKVEEGQLASAYKCGDFVDLCAGPHLPRSGLIASLRLEGTSESKWRGADSLVRVRGAAFGSEGEPSLVAGGSNHRVIGERQRLFFFNESSPGSCYFLPHGTRLFNRLVDFMRREYRLRGFQEVCTPNIFRASLFKTSGHYFKYRENMFFLGVEGQSFGLKPMNCPAHCEVFSSSLRSYRDLPLRLADFGALHRNEASGALGGLTRVRKFHQDDGHIFIAEDQIEKEVADQLDFLKYVYGIFGFEFEFELSTRPEKFLGSIEVWDKAEAALKSVLDKHVPRWKLNPGDGAIYGPKIDIKIKDGHNRPHQLGTIQLDFVQPIRFNLQYRDSDDGESPSPGSSPAQPHTPRSIPNKPLTLEEEEVLYAQEGKLKHGFKRPIIVHRAVFGSIERCIAILSEHFNGKWPFWLSPRQVIVLPLTDSQNEYATKVQNRLLLEGFDAEVDLTPGKINKKIREAQLSQFNYILVVGAKEASNFTVNVRERDDPKPKGEFSLPTFIACLKKLVPEPSEHQRKIISESSFGPHEKPEILAKLELNFDELQKWNSEIENKSFFGGDQQGELDRKVINRIRFVDVEALGLAHLAKWKKSLI